MITQRHWGNFYYDGDSQLRVYLHPSREVAESEQAPGRVGFGCLDLDPDGKIVAGTLISERQR